MAKTREHVRPIFDAKPEFQASLDRFIHEAGMLADAVRTALDMGALKGPVEDLIRIRLKAFSEAQSGGPG